MLTTKHRTAPPQRTLWLKVSVRRVIPFFAGRWNGEPKMMVASIPVEPLHPPSESRICNAAAAAKSPQSCLTLCDPIDGSPPGSPSPGILQARTLEWVAISFSNA